MKQVLSRVSSQQLRGGREVFLPPCPSGGTVVRGMNRVQSLSLLKSKPFTGSVPLSPFLTQVTPVMDFFFLLL